MKKKIMSAIYVILFVVILTLTIKQIIAATSSSTTTINEYQTDWGTVTITKEIDETSKVEIQGEFTAKPTDHLKDDDDYLVTYSSLQDVWSRYCVEHGAALSSNYLEIWMTPNNMKTRATENADETWVGETIEDTMGWDEAYIYAHADPSADAGTEENTTQLALWKVLNPNDDDLRMTPEAEKLYKEAKAFKKYKDSSATMSGMPEVVKRCSESYTFSYVRDGSINGLIAGPIQINYQTEFEDTTTGEKLTVGELGEISLYGMDLTTGREDSIANFEFVSLDFTQIWAKEEFPFNQAVYIYIPNYSGVFPLYNYISRLEIGVSKMDLKAASYKLDGVFAHFFDKDGAETYTQIQKLSFLKKAEMYWEKCPIKIHFYGERPVPSPSAGGWPPPGDNWEPPTIPSPVVPPSNPEGPGSPDTGFSPPNVESPSATPKAHKLYLDIGGKVWVDEAVSKTDDPDGKFGTGTDYDRPNVKVTLYYEGGGIVPPSASNAQAIFKNPTWTSANGDYLFPQLPVDKKYYVEFTYDGMMYTTTEFLKGGSVPGYEAAANDEMNGGIVNFVYTTNSKAIEAQRDRNEFNKNFEEIKGTGPSSLSGEYTTIDMGSMVLKYKSKVFADSSLFQSRLLTTTNEYDVEQDHATGIARPATGTGKESDYDREKFEIKVNTKDSGIKCFPFGDGTNIRIPIWSVEKGQELDYLKHINLGLKRRQTADLNIAVDLRAGGTSIKDKTKLVNFKSNIALDENNNPVINIDEETTTGIIKGEELNANTTGTYVQDISGADYYWLSNYESIYKDPVTGIEQFTGLDTVTDKLNVYVLYKIVIGNQSPAEETKATVTGLVDYFSKEFEIPNSDYDKAKIQEIFGKYNPSGYSWKAEDSTKKEVNWIESGEENGYKKLTTEENNFNLEIGGSGESKTIYLVLKVREEDNKLLINNNGMTNITEITSYKLHDSNGKPLGLVDCDSAPYNATPGKEETYEDDTDAAPMFKLNIVLNTKKISGNVWEELEDGSKDTKIKYVKVELIEYIFDKENETIEQVIRPGLTIIENGEIKTIGVKKDVDVRTDENGDYTFLVEGGNYAVRFTYGDNIMLASNKKYNAQDYRASNNSSDNKKVYENLSNIYTSEVENNHNVACATTEELKTYLLGRTLLEISDELKIGDEPEKSDSQKLWEETNWNPDISNDYSNARDLTSIRSKVISSVLPSLTYENAPLLHKLNEGEKLEPDDIKKLTGDDNKESINYTYMEAVSEILVIESNDLGDREYKINLALKERPVTDIKLEKEVTRIVLKSNDGVTLIDSADSLKVANLAKDPANGIQTSLMYLDAKMMEGATVDIDYKIKVSNVGKENDMLENYIYDAKSADTVFIVDEREDFTDLKVQLNKIYRNPDESSIEYDTPIPIRAKRIFDYVNINLEYRKDNNGGENSIWTKIYDEDDTDSSLHELSPDRKKLLSTDVQSGIQKHINENNEKITVSKVIETNENAETSTTKGNMLEGDSKEITLHLGMTLSEDTGVSLDNQMVYQNCAEIVDIYPGLGRRDYDIIPGDYVPYTKIEEDGTMDDSALTGTTTIIPPTGQNRIYYVIAVISATIVIVGIVVIKKKVLRK